MSQPQKDLVAIGASWCGYSQRQLASLEATCDGTWDSENTTCHMGNGRKVGIVMCNNVAADGTVDNEFFPNVCKDSQGLVSGYPTWVETSDDGDIKLMEQQVPERVIPAVPERVIPGVPERVIPATTSTVHFVSGICELPTMKGSADCQ